MVQRINSFLSLLMFLCGLCLNWFQDNFSVDFAGVDASGTFTLMNNCPYTVWPGFYSTGSTPIPATGFELGPDQSTLIQPPSGWMGRFWARTHCSKNSTGKFTCLTGDCGSGKIECDGGFAASPVTLVEFNMDGSQGMDYYDVSVIGGYNLPLLVEPKAVSRASCSTTGCVVDLNSTCPADLKVTAKGGEDVACKSECTAFNQDKDCCRGVYSAPDTCAGASSYIKAFKSACPHVYTYLLDNVTELSCAGADYKITFCPPQTTSQNQQPDNNNFSPSRKNGTMIYHGETDFVNSRAVSLSSTTSTCTHVLRFAGTVAVASLVNAVVL